jgi:tungstate transport system substrate-binding protein
MLLARPGVLVAIALAIAAVAAPATRADNASTLTVVGTSDVFDSDLVQSVLKPGFEAAHPRYTLDYVSKGSGAAIEYAEAGTASALLVHAASLENQFVARGYSLERYGRAIFWGDYVILGPASDPAGVTSNAPHDAATAFERIAAAGAAGRANFVSRGGTPGTTVQEHAIWALTHGVKTCTVDAADGGGASPSTAGGRCPANVATPSWYHATGLTQGPNIENADTCNYAGGHCYVLTDRGTFEYLVSTGAIHDLGIVTRNNGPTARGGTTLLVNSFHAYALNPARFRGQSGVQLNVPAARAFLRWITSPPAQAAIGAFLGAKGDAPFVPDAAPDLTLAALPGVPAGGRDLTLTGALRNVVPGAPPLGGVPVTLSSSGAVLARAVTGSDGRFSLRHRFQAHQRYTVASGPIGQVEKATLTPVFGDLLAPASRTITPGSPAVAPAVTPAAGTHSTVAGSAAAHASPHTVRWVLGALVAALLLGAIAVVARRGRFGARGA